jgi:hypothetical protein
MIFGPWIIDQLILARFHNVILYFSTTIVLLLIYNCLFQRLVYSLPDQSLPDIFTTIVQSSFEEKLKILDAVDLPERFDAALALIQRQITVYSRINSF